MGTTLALCKNLAKAAEENHTVYVFFYKYNKNSIKSQERERRTQRVIYPDYKLSINTTLQARDTIMKNSNTKRQLINIICTHSESQNTHIIGEEQTMFQHEEVDVCINSYLFHLIRLYWCEVCTGKLWWHRYPSATATQLDRNQAYRLQWKSLIIQYMTSVQLQLGLETMWAAIGHARADCMWYYIISIPEGDCLNKLVLPDRWVNQDS